MQRILLIEDDRDINESNQTALELEGYEVRTALSMHAGVNLCETFHPDLVLLDIILPDANALDWGRRLKEDYGVNILYLSGLNTKEDVIRGLRAGGDDYMTKPYLIEELLLRVSSLIRRRDQPAMREDFSTGKLIWHVAAKQIELNGEELQLQPKEYAVLEYLQRSSVRYVSSQELAEKICYALMVQKYMNKAGEEE
jgi:DNA-binding response OmpR family regulator